MFYKALDNPQINDEFENMPNSILLNLQLSPFKIELNFFGSPPFQSRISSVCAMVHRRI